MQTTQSTVWFIRIQGRVRGPFPLQKLEQLRDQGRLDPRTEVSANRTSWVLAGSLLELYPPGSIPAEVVKSPHDKSWFYQQDGQRVGPVPLSTLQLMASSGQLAPHELVWVEGMATWGPASHVVELGFLQRGPRGFSSFSTVKKLAVLVPVLALFIVPGWFVVKINYERVAEQRRVMEVARQEQIRKAELVRQEKQRQEDIALKQAEVAATEEVARATRENTAEVARSATENARNHREAVANSNKQFIDRSVVDDMRSREERYQQDRRDEKNKRK